MDILTWIERTKRRHRQCLNWQSNGAVALAVTVPTGVRADWTRWFQAPEVMLESELARLDHYSQFEDRLALISQTGFPGRSLGRTRNERLRNFRAAAEDFLERFEGKSGLIVTCGAATVEEAQEFYGVWDSICPWPEETVPPSAEKTPN